MIAEARLPAGPTLTPDDIVREVRHLPSAPKVLPRLKQLLGDGNSAMHEIVALIRLDPGIAARVLQIGNSAYFSAGSRCLTVDEAVNRVGYEQVYQLVSYAVASQVLIRPLDVYGIESEELWRMSVAGALAAEVLAERTRQDRNIAYTVGLLHCVGMVAIDEWALHNARHLFLPRGVYPREAIDSERAVLGFTQAETGGALLRHWGFPGGITEPVRWQYTPRASSGYMRMASLLSAAKWLRNTVCGCRPPVPEAVHLQPLGLTAAALDGLATAVERRLGEVTDLLEQGESITLDRDQFPAARWGR
jgi:HD-like signal output (HDOD) protein